MARGAKGERGEERREADGWEERRRQSVCTGAPDKERRDAGKRAAQANAATVRAISCRGARGRWVTAKPAALGEQGDGEGE